MIEDSHCFLFFLYSLAKETDCTYLTCCSRASHSLWLSCCLADLGQILFPNQLWAGTGSEVELQGVKLGSLGFVLSAGPVDIEEKVGCHQKNSFVFFLHCLCFVQLHFLYS